MRTRKREKAPAWRRRRWKEEEKGEKGQKKGSFFVFCSLAPHTLSPFDLSTHSSSTAAPAQLPSSTFLIPPTMTSASLISGRSFSRVAEPRKRTREGAGGFALSVFCEGVKKKTNASHHQSSFSPLSKLPNYTPTARTTAATTMRSSIFPRASAFSAPRRAMFSTAASRKVSSSMSLASTISAKPSRSAASVVAIRAAIAEPQAPSKTTGGGEKLKIGINGESCVLGERTSAEREREREKEKEREHHSHALVLSRSLEREPLPPRRPIYLRSLSHTHTSSFLCRSSCHSSHQASAASAASSCASASSATTSR